VQCCETHAKAKALFLEALAHEARQPVGPVFYWFFELLNSLKFLVVLCYYIKDDRPSQTAN